MARRGRKPKGPMSLWDKVKAVDENFAVGINAMSEKDIREKLVTMANEDNTFEKSREDDSDLRSLREQLKTAGQTYTVPLTNNKLRRRLCLQTLKERGQLDEPA
jgi:hypothetical protein